MSRKDTFVHILQTIGPMVLMALPGKAGTVARAVAPAIVQGVIEAQRIPGASNSDKKSHALTVVTMGLSAMRTEGHVVLPEADVIAAASVAIDTVIATAHVVEGTHLAVRAPQV